MWTIFSSYYLKGSPKFTTTESLLEYQSLYANNIQTPFGEANSRNCTKCDNKMIGRAFVKS